MKEHPELSEALEDYLETILNLEGVQKVARAKDIAASLGVQRGSVTSALKSLKEKGLINYEPYSFITLTPKGIKRAKGITQRHDVIKDFLLTILQIDEETADSTACRMEHAIDEITLQRLVCFIEYFSICPRTGETWKKSFVNYCASGEWDPEQCERCIEN